MNNSYCEFCNDFLEYDIKLMKEKERINNVEVKYYKKKTYCKKCGNEIFVNSILDENVMMLQKAYREKIGIITVQQIEELVELYGVGKRNLSKLLGFGELTLTRYLNMDMPTKLYSEVLLSVFDYRNMLSIASENKNKVSEKVYNKLLKNITLIIQSENNNKLIAVSKYIVLKAQDITNLAVQKLLYFSQVVSAALNSNLLFRDSCEAWRYGPVYPVIYRRLNKYTYDCINESEFSNEETMELGINDKEIVDAVINTFGLLSGIKLKELSHKTEPWIDARKGISEIENSNEIITNKSIKEYAKTLSKYPKNAEAFCNEYMKDLLNK